MLRQLIVTEARSRYDLGAISVQCSRRERVVISAQATSCAAARAAKDAAAAAAHAGTAADDAAAQAAEMAAEAAAEREGRLHLMRKTIAQSRPTIWDLMQRRVACVLDR